MYERRSTDSAPPPAPLGATARLRPPDDVRIGDFVHLDDMFLRVQDMRAASTAAQRVLIFDGHPPWVMRQSTITYRPIELA